MPREQIHTKLRNFRGSSGLSSGNGFTQRSKIENMTCSERGCRRHAHARAPKAPQLAAAHIGTRAFSSCLRLTRKGQGPADRNPHPVLPDTADAFQDRYFIVEPRWGVSG